MAEFVPVGRAAELPPGSKRLIDIEGRAVAIFNVDGSFYCIDDMCTHDGGPLAEGELHGCEITCPRHGARFDMRTGAALCMPAFEPVRAHEVMLRAGELLVKLTD